ncbi:MAG: DUF805 domain-containing protein [Rhodobacteraceae bacterium]|nr:DUF805 domain-containing protein [Paracoccaceae bacterium]
MGFVEAIQTCFSKYIDFTGRAARAEFWWWQLFLVIVWFTLAIIDVALLGVDFSLGEVGVLTTLFGLAVLLPGLAVSVRRLHDIDRSGWWAVSFFSPFLVVSFNESLTRTRGRILTDRVNPLYPRTHDPLGDLFNRAFGLLDQERHRRREPFWPGSDYPAGQPLTSTARAPPSTVRRSFDRSMISGAGVNG